MDRGYSTKAVPESGTAFFCIQLKVERDRRARFERARRSRSTCNPSPIFRLTAKPLRDGIPPNIRRLFKILVGITNTMIEKVVLPPDAKLFMSKTFPVTHYL
jgi:hypothetical protein